MGLREQSIVDCFPEFVFHISVTQMLVRLRNQFINNFIFPTWACAAGFNTNNNVQYRQVNPSKAQQPTITPLH